MDENNFKTELDYELKRFNKDKEVKKINEKFEKEITLFSLDPLTTASTDVSMTPLPDPAIIEVQLEHRKALAAYAKENNYHLAYEYYTKELGEA